MISASFEYARAGSVEEAIQLLGSNEDAKVIAGGQSLLILIRERLIDAEILIGLRGIEPLRRLDIDGEARIGAMVTHATAEHEDLALGGGVLGRQPGDQPQDGALAAAAGA